MVSKTSVASLQTDQRLQLAKERGLVYAVKMWTPDVFERWRLKEYVIKLGASGSLSILHRHLGELPPIKVYPTGGWHGLELQLPAPLAEYGPKWNAWTPLDDPDDAERYLQPTRPAPHYEPCDRLTVHPEHHYDQRAGSFKICPGRQEEF